MHCRVLERPRDETQILQVLNHVRILDMAHPQVSIQNYPRVLHLVHLPGSSLVWKEEDKAVKVEKEKEKERARGERRDVAENAFEKERETMEEIKRMCWRRRIERIIFCLLRKRNNDLLYCVFKACCTYIPTSERSIR